MGDLRDLRDDLKTLRDGVSLPEGKADAILDEAIVLLEQLAHLEPKIPPLREFIRLLPRIG